MTTGFELGPNSFAEVATDEDGAALSDAQAVRLLATEPVHLSTGALR